MSRIKQSTNKALWFVLNEQNEITKVYHSKLECRLRIQKEKNTYKGEAK